jgi:hypothetical protein
MMIPPEHFRKIRIGLTIVAVFAVSAAVTAGGFWLASELQKEDPKVATVEQVATAPAASYEDVTGRCIDALLRTWEITDACHDKKTNNYFVNIAAHTPVEGRYDAGWYMLDKYKFLELSNGTYVIQEAGLLIDVTPDTTGLLCKHQVKIWN